jgi:hypothetical protein
VDNSIGSFFTQSGLDAGIKYKAYEIRHVIKNYKPYTVHETEPATAVSRQLSGTTPDLDVLQQERTTPHRRFRGMSLGWLFHRDFLLDEVMKRWPDSN